MKIGVCGWIDKTEVAGKCGFDYIEPSFKNLALSENEQYDAFKNALYENCLGCEAANGFLPPETKIVGVNTNYNSLKEYLTKGYKRAYELGVKTVVLGSGGARQIPRNYPYKSAIKDVVRFVRDYAAPMAGDYGINFVFEPLCRYETNLINTVKEGAMLASAIDMPNVGCLGDIYHMYVEGDTYDDIRELKGILMHAHISNPVSERPDMKRCYMKNTDEYDYKGFIDALKFAGCERVSIEADTKDFNADAPAAYKVLKQLCK
ncbi:MAG: sugar phosphate isomerase/epimerase [Clostridiales bacterium]|nr:sugar phosphate isomerase/epimerase [Clostridiales bacterium]